MSDPIFILGTRGSPLAVAQARMVAGALEAAHGWPAGSVALREITTSGDRIQDRALAEVGGKALWTKELDRALAAGETHASVHSMKDVESGRPDAFRLAAMLPRADVRDRLIGAASVADLPPGARFGTSSPRREAQMRRLRPDLNVVLLRGNVARRLAQCEMGAVDATLLAAAGLDRLGMGDVGVALDALLPAPGQGAVGIECRADDAWALERIGAIDHRPTHDELLAERAFAFALGAGCRSPVAALARCDGGGTGGEVTLRVQLLSTDGAEAVERERRFGRGDGMGPADFARALLAEAPEAVRRLFDGA